MSRLRSQCEASLEESAMDGTHGLSNDPILDCAGRCPQQHAINDASSLGPFFHDPHCDKETTDADVGTTVKDAVTTEPSHFNEAKRLACLQAQGHPPRKSPCPGRQVRSEAIVAFLSLAKLQDHS